MGNVANTWVAILSKMVCTINSFWTGIPSIRMRRGANGFFVPKEPRSALNITKLLERRPLEKHARDFAEFISKFIRAESLQEKKELQNTSKKNTLAEIHRSTNGALEHSTEMR